MLADFVRLVAACIVLAALLHGIRIAATALASRCIGCHTHHLPGHDCDGQPLDKTRETT